MIEYFLIVVVTLCEPPHKQQRTPIGPFATLDLCEQAMGHPHTWMPDNLPSTCFDIDMKCEARL